MKAIIFAAGLGTRIQSLNQNKPKALLLLNGKTLLQYAIEYLEKNGVSDIIINVHHHADLIIEFIEQSHFKSKISISDERDALLDTGGGLLKAKNFFKSETNFVAYNVDIITNLNLQNMIENHKLSPDAIATLAIRDRETSRYLLFDDKAKMIGWKNNATNELILHQDKKYNSLAFSGIHLISTQIFDLLQAEGQSVFSITKSYINLSKNHAIYGYKHNDDYWFDVGKPETYKLASEFLKQKSS